MFDNSVDSRRRGGVGGFFNKHARWHSVGVNENGNNIFHARDLHSTIWFDVYNATIPAAKVGVECARVVACQSTNRDKQLVGTTAGIGFAVECERTRDDDDGNNQNADEFYEGGHPFGLWIAR